MAYGSGDTEPTKEEDRAAYWNDKIREARTFEEMWRERSQALVDKYRDDGMDRQDRPFHRIDPSIP